MKLTDGWNLCGIKILDEKTKELPVYFHSIGHYNGQKHVFRPDGLGQYQICICTDGNGVFSFDGMKYDIKKGDIFFLSPSVGHEYYPVSSNWTVIWLVFNGKNVKSVIDYFDFENAFVCKCHEEKLCRMIEICESLYATYNENEKYEFSLTTDVLKIIEMVGKCERVENSTFTNHSGSFSPVLEYVKANYMNFITLDDMAEKSGLSKSHFCRQFKNDYAVTPLAYLNNYRISVAKFLLSTTKESIDVIAGKTGFSDASYFCAVFKKQEGCSPGKYRERH